MLGHAARSLSDQAYQSYGSDSMNGACTNQAESFPDSDRTTPLCFCSRSATPTRFVISRDEARNDRGIHRFRRPISSRSEPTPITSANKSPPTVAPKKGPSPLNRPQIAPIAMKIPANTDAARVSSKSHLALAMRDSSGARRIGRQVRR